MSDSSFGLSSANKKASKTHKRLLRFVTLILGRFLSSSNKFINPRDITDQSCPSAASIVRSVQEMKEEEEVGVMRRSVKQLHFGGPEEKEAAAAEIKRLVRGDQCARRSFAEYGVIPALVSMVMEAGEDGRRRRKLAVEALIELANGTFTNKVLMVEAGLLSNLPELIACQDTSTKKELASLLMSISFLAKTCFPITTSHFLPFLLNILTTDQDDDDEIKVTCIATLYNLSTKLDNIKLITSNGFVHALLKLSLHKKTSEGALATLGNLVISSTGKKAVEDESMAPEVLIEVMAWDDKPKCQELAAYVLMVLAHGSLEQRKKMAGLGIVPLLLEVALLGTSLAQKRAIKMLQWFKYETMAKMAAHSGPQAERTSEISDSPPLPVIGHRGVKESRRTVKMIVKQSLDRNMEVITRRANKSHDSSQFRALVLSSSSKSLPY